MKKRVDRTEIKKTSRNRGDVRRRKSMSADMESVPAYSEIAN